MTYYFEGLPRIQFLFDSPNKFGLFLCLIFPVFVWIRHCFRGRTGIRFFVLSYIPLVIIIVLEYLLIRSYSRGGMVAFWVSLLVLAFCGLHRTVLEAGGAFLFLLVVVPKAATRITSVNLVDDHSIWHRLLLWKSACEMSFTCFPFGVGRNIGEVFMAWHQASEKHELYLTAVSDLLTIAAKYGAVLLFIVLTISLFAIIVSVCVSRQQGGSMHSVFSAVVAAYLVGGIFSTFYTTWQLSAIFIGCVISAIASSVFALEGRCVTLLRSASIASLVVCLMILFCGMWSYGTGNIRYNYHNIDGTKCCLVKLNDCLPKHMIVYMFDEDASTLEKEGRLSIRPLLRKDVQVMVVGVEPTVNGLEKARNILRWVESMYPDLNVRFVGQGCGGSLSLVLACESNRVDRVVSIGAYASWPILEVSPEDAIVNKRGLSVAILTGEKDWHAGTESAERILKVCLSHSILTKLKIIKGVGGSLDNQRATVLRDALEWLCKEEALICVEGC